ncbi:hypothetical protein [Winogradskyella aurantiaca]|uniref:hypothetical protein n=1 Tax=Winogradskyella aurantiaca TaxID=2219558 RepID=UPI000E1E05A5|nr:hypothetical protein [Winogradskyella aurantiaca]
MKKTLQILISIALLTSCGNIEKPKVIYEENQNVGTAELKRDSTLIEIADIPIHIDSTTYLIHPIGEYKIYGSRGKSYFGSSSSGFGTFAISNYNRYEITGDLYNLKFQELNSENLSSLTSKNIRIKSVSFLRDVFDNNKKQFLVYRILDSDTNKDNELDDTDIKSLYISNIDGTNFQKLTAEFQELIDWKVIPIKNRLYFRSIEDSNKNGEFDKEDKIHYQYVDFNKNEIKVTEYKPL